MANAFSLFGELKVDTTGFNRDLNKATNQLQHTTTEMTRAEKSTASFGKSMGAISGGASSALGGVTALAAGVAALGAVAVTAAGALFKMTSEAAEWGSSLYDASIKTGLSAKAVTALSLAAQSSGSSLSAVSSSVAKFNVILGQAAQGSTKAQAVLAKYNITAKDTDTAFAQAVSTLKKYEGTVKANTASMELFKDRTGQMLPLVDQVDGQFEKYIETLQKLGVTMSKDDLKAADDFGDSLDALGMQAKVVGARFLTQMMPDITRAMNAIGQAIANNAANVSRWGQNLSDTFRGLSVAASSATSSMVGSFASWAANIFSYIDPVQRALIGTIRLLRQTGAEARAKDLSGITSQGGAVVDAMMRKVKPVTGDISLPSMGGGRGGGSRGGGGISAAEKAAREAEQDAARSLSANMSRATLALKRMWEELEGAVKSSFTAMLEYGGTSDDVMASMTAGMQPYIDNINKVRAAIEYLENSKRDSMNADEKANLLQQQLYARKEDEKKIEELLASMRTEAIKIDKDYYDQLEKAQETAIEQSTARLDILKEIGAVSILPFENQQLTAKDFGLSVDSEGNPVPEGLVPPLTDWEDFWGMMSQRMTEFRESLPSMKEAIGENLIGGIMELGNVFGTAINDWIANGENFFKAIAKGFRQMVANIIGELVRLMVFQLLMKIIGVGASAAGSGAAPGGGVNSSAGSWGGGWGFADGGMISGKGTSTSDSILARLSNGEFVMSAKAVKRWGADTLASMNSGMMPAFAGGGLVGGSSSVTTNAPVYNIHINGGGNQDTVRSVKQGIREATRMQQREEWRRK